MTRTGMNFALILTACFALSGRPVTGQTGVLWGLAGFAIVSLAPALGLPPEVPSWGNMLSEERIYVTRAPWLLIFPGALIILSVFSMNLVGDAMRDRIDPRFKDDIAGV